MIQFDRDEIVFHPKEIYDYGKLGDIGYEKRVNCEVKPKGFNKYI